MDPKLVKLFLVCSFHVVLIYLLLHFKFSRKFIFLKNFFAKVTFSIIFFIIFFILNEILYDNYKYTLYIIHAALLTIWYTELAFYLEKYFWRDFLQNQLPFSINLLLSFVLMINAGYFTLMFIIRIALFALHFFGLSKKSFIILHNIKSVIYQLNTFINSIICFIF